MTADLEVRVVSSGDEPDAVRRQAPIATPLAKVAFDKAVALFSLCVLAPVLAAIAAAIKIGGWTHGEDRGPVLYKEARVGQDRVFTLYKFRVVKTASIEAARRKVGHDHVKPLEKREKAKTRVGRWLQRYYLDELPQLFNVLKGDMSLVGPRPWPVPMVERETARGVYRKRLLRPGLTGLVQAHKDELKTLDDSIGLDESYIEACRTLSPVRLLLLDLRVITASFRILARGQGL